MASDPPTVVASTSAEDFLGEGSPDPERLAVQTIRSLTQDDTLIRVNKWRPDPKLTPENIVLEAAIGKGTFGVVFRGHNRDTQVQYAFKVQIRRTDKKSSREPGDRSPNLTRSSEASIIDDLQVGYRSLFQKRTNETRTSLQYIKSGHPNVCNLEAWGEFSTWQQEYFLSVFELCDCCTIWDLTHRFRGEAEFPPEGFIWKVFEQIFDGLAFLHGEHPDYKDREEYRTNRSVVMRDIKPNNIFLQWPKERATENHYPNVKLGDFGEAIHLPIGGTRTFEYGNNCSDAPDPGMSTKFDVWTGAMVVWYMATSGKFPWPPNDTEERRRMPPVEWRRWRNLHRDRITHNYISDHYSAQLETDLKWVLNMEMEVRPGAAQVLRRMKRRNRDRGTLLYRALPDWAVLATFENLQLNQDRLNVIDEEEEVNERENRNKPQQRKRRRKRRAIREFLERQAEEQAEEERRQQVHRPRKRRRMRRVLKSRAYYAIDA